jgi:hypothetical protein
MHQSMPTLHQYVKPGSILDLGELRPALPAPGGRAGGAPKRRVSLDFQDAGAAPCRWGHSMNRRVLLLATIAAALGSALVMPRAHGQTRKALRRVGVLFICDPAVGTTSSQDMQARRWKSTWRSSRRADFGWPGSTCSGRRC